uniref:G-protein coupled receptors family 1 profile domain-containing protein n=1 Tax=Rhizophagus irregularis (strain DAOM 181602 / DAOM 197198 / MUCL 43194) TaxID=747089 RepID=U9TMA7_RHIID
MSIQKVSSQQLNRTYSIAPNYPNNDRTGLYILAIPCIICNQLSLAGCFYVLFGTFRRWRAAPTRLVPMTLRIPFYIAITDLLLYTMNFPNILFTLIFHHPWPDPICGIIGFASNLFMNLNMTLSLMLSIFIYVRVCRNEYFLLGPYDWKLILVVLISSVLLASFSSNDYGNDTWWCASSHKKVSYKVLFKKTISEESGVTDVTHKKLVEINYKFGTKVVTYIIIFVLQWVFSFPYHITRLNHDRSVWTFILFGISVNSGGILNGIQYHLNGGWKIKPNTSNNTDLNSGQLEQITVTTTEDCNLTTISSPSLTK